MRGAVVTTVFLAAAVAARADMRPAEDLLGPDVAWTSLAAATSTATTAVCPTPTAPTGTGLADEGVAGFGHGRLAPPEGSLEASGAAVPAGEARELPAAPGSAGLFLSAMLSIGGWHMVRSARHIHLGALPEWYHTGGPVQVGHAVPCDLDFSASPLCCFEQPVGERPYLYRVRRDHTPRCDAQCLLIIAAPRGPPSLSSSC